MIRPGPFDEPTHVGLPPRSRRSGALLISFGEASAPPCGPARAAPAATTVLEATVDGDTSATTILLATVGFIFTSVSSLALTALQLVAPTAGRVLRVAILASRVSGRITEGSNADAHLFLSLGPSLGLVAGVLAAVVATLA